MKIATFNINGINGRLSSLLQWLEEAAPDVVCLQELKCSDTNFPATALEKVGYKSIWHGEGAWNGVAILGRGAKPVETRRGLPGKDDDRQARYIEAAVSGVIVGALYLPNGNPWPGPKFDYKLAWFERLTAHARGLLASGAPVALVGDYNVVPTDFDIYDPRNWRDNALLQPESRDAFARLVEQGWTDALRHLFPRDPVFTFWDYKRNRWPRDAGMRLDHFLLSPDLAERLADGGVDREARGREHASDHAPAWIELRPTAQSKR